MQERIEEELIVIRKRFKDAEYNEAGAWVRILNYPLPDGWNQTSTDVAFQILPSYPGTPPYGIYVPIGLQFQNERPANYTEPANNQPPFPGTWGVFSWSPDGGGWKPTADVRTGSNLLNWVLGFANRFREGK